MSFLLNPLQASDLAQGWNMMAFLKISYYVNNLSLCPETKPSFLLWSDVPTDCFWTERSQRAPTCLWHKLWCSFPQSPGELVLGMGAALTQPLLHSSTSPGSREGHGYTQKESTRTPLSLLPLMLSPHTLLRFLQAPTVVSKFNKAFIFPPPPQLVILEIALSEDKVQRWHRSTSLRSSSKVHISLQAGCPSPHFLRTK